MKRSKRKDWENSMSDSKRPPYSVGYGRPPVESQFQKGKSGNPDGRRKEAKTVNAKIRDALNKEMPAIDGRQQIILTKKRAIIRSVIQKALAGDARAAETILQRVRATEPKQE